MNNLQLNFEETVNYCVILRQNIEMKLSKKCEIRSLHMKNTLFVRGKGFDDFENKKKMFPILSHA